MKHRLTLFFPIAVFLPIAAVAQTQEQPRAITPQYDPNLAVNLPVQKVAPEDLVSINVYDSPEFTRTARVQPDGTIRMPMLKNTIQVDGLLPSEIEERIAQELKQEGLLVDPFVTVNVAEYHSRPVSVMGSVRLPTVFQAVGAGNDTLMDALAKAQGLTPDAGPEIVVTSPKGANGEKTVQRIPAKALLSGNNPELNLKLKGGEEVSVPAALTFVVEGSVTKPGVYPVLDPIFTNTVTTAIAQAGGLIQYADHTIYIYRTGADGKQAVIPVKLWDIQKHKAPDIQLQAKDILYIPDSTKRRLTQEAVNAMTGFGASAGAGVIIAAANAR